MKTKTIYFIGFFIFSFITYAIFANPDVTFTDNGELAGVISTFGVAHPTGYPLFTLLGHLWSLIPNPFETIYWLNLFATFTTALSVSVFYLITYELFEILKIKINTQAKEHHTLPVSVTLIYFTAKTIWEQGLSLEVYSLQLLMFNLIILFFLKILNSKKPDRWLLLTALTAGLSFSNHMTTILIMPSLLIGYMMIKNDNSKLLNNKFKTIFILIVPFVLGLSLYLTLPVISSGSPAFNWGAVHRNLDKFLYHVTGKQYQIWMFSGSEAVGENLVKFFTLVPYQLAFVGVLLSILGIITSFKFNKTLAVFFALSIITCVSYSVNYSIHDIDAYFSLAFISLLIFIVFAIKYLTEKKYKVYTWISVLWIIGGAVNIQTNDQSDDVLVKEYMISLTKELDENAVILSAQWDYWCSAFWYYQEVENYRPDIKLVEKELLRRTWYPLQLRNWYPELCQDCEKEMNLYEEQLELFEEEEQYNPMLIQNRFENLLKCFINKNIGNKPVYVTLDILQTEPNLLNDYELIPEGLAFRVLPKGTQQKPFIDIKSLDKFITATEKYNSGHLEKGIAQVASMALTNAGRLSIVQQNINEAELYFQTALKIDKDNQIAKQTLQQIKGMKK